MFIRCHPSYIFQTTLNFVPNNTNQTARNVSDISNLTRELTCFFLFLVSNKGISGVLILLMFLWKSLSIHGQKCMKGRKDILEAFPCNLGNSFFAKKKKKNLFYTEITEIEITRGRNSEALLYFPALISQDTKEWRQGIRTKSHQGQGYYPVQ